MILFRKKPKESEIYVPDDFVLHELKPSNNIVMTKDLKSRQQEELIRKMYRVPKFKSAYIQ